MSSLDLKNEAKMNVYNAIMLAADHIGRHPEEFNFHSVQIPGSPHCGTPGCALGWVATFARLTLHQPHNHRIQETATLIGARSAGEFYCRMTSLVGSRWTEDARICARGMRLYAEKYHSEEKSQRRSDSELVADLMARVSGSRIPDEAPADAVSA